MSANISFEFFPPRTEALENQLWACIRRLEPLAPHFVSVTYGAGGSTRERTHATVKRIVEETTLKPAAHLTCVAASAQLTLFAALLRVCASFASVLRSFPSNSGRSC